MESAFQFSNPSLTKMEFCINEDFENGRDKEVKMAVNMGIHLRLRDHRRRGSHCSGRDLGRKLSGWQRM